MEIFFEPILFPDDKDRLVRFLTSEKWPFHVNSHLSKEKVYDMIEEGTFGGSNHESFWIVNTLKEEIGFIRLLDLDDIEDGYPLFDLRIRTEFRGRGLGKAAVRWLTRYLFERHPKLERVAGTTRADNLAMRRAFRSNGYVKEGHYRKDWSSSDGNSFDTVRYGILREDWVSGTTTVVRWNDEN